MEQKLSRDVDAHVAKSFIKPIQMILFFSIMPGFDCSSHGHPVKTFVTQGNLHISPPIKVVEGCKDSES